MLVYTIHSHNALRQVDTIGTNTVSILIDNSFEITEPLNAAPPLHLDKLRSGACFIKDLQFTLAFCGLAISI